MLQFSDCVQQKYNNLCNLQTRLNSCKYIGMLLMFVLESFSVFRPDTPSPCVRDWNVGLGSPLPVNLITYIFPLITLEKEVVPETKLFGDNVVISETFDEDKIRGILGDVNATDLEATQPPILTPINLRDLIEILRYLSRSNLKEVKVQGQIKCHQNLISFMLHYIAYTGTCQVISMIYVS